MLERLGNSLNDKNTKNMNLLLETTWFYSNEQKKQIWSINGPIFLTVKLSGKKRSNETRLFCKDTYGKRMWFKCATPMYYFKRIGILSENALYTPIFCILWTVLKIISNHYFPARTDLFEKLATFSWMTNRFGGTDLFQYLRSILQNE